MRYIDKRAIGLIYFFCEYSGVFADLRDVNRETVINRLSEMSRWEKQWIANLVRSSLRKLAGRGYDLNRLVPDDILALGCVRSLSGLARGDRMLPFFDMLIDLFTTAEQNRVANLAAVKNAAFSMDSFSRSFARSFFSLNNQRIMLSAEGDGVILTTAEHPWGRVSAHFEGCTFDSNMPPMAIPGYAFGTEISSAKGGELEVSMLIDTHFGSNNYIDRMFSDEGWQELHFTCREFRVRPELTDYAGRLEKLGTSRVSIVEKSCAAIVNKQMILGTDGLAAGERDLLPAAQLMCGVFGLLNTENDFSVRQSEDNIISALDNRWAISRLCDMLRECGCEELCRLLEQAHSFRQDEDLLKAMKYIRLFAANFGASLASGDIRLFISQLCDRLTQASEQAFDHDNTLLTAERYALEEVRAAVETELCGMGFDGVFPHYRRKRSGGYDYLSFVVREKYERPCHRIMHYNISVAAAQISASQWEKYKSKGSDDNKSNALDCLPECYGISRYGELASEDDGEYVEIKVRLHSEKGPSFVENTCHCLPRYIHYAEKQFSHGRIPREYRRRKKRTAGIKGRFLRSFSECLPVGLFTSIAAMLCYILVLRSNEWFPLSAFESAIAAIAAGTAVSALCGMLRCFALSFRLWRY